MTRLQLNPDEKLTRKEYLKRKKKQSRIFKPRSKVSYIFIMVMTVALVYACVQLYIYKMTNNFKYVADDSVQNQTVYSIYYVTEGYTYDPVYTLNNVRSDGFDDDVIYANSGLHTITLNEDYVLGIKDNLLYKLDRKSNKLEKLTENQISNYTQKNDIAYYITSAGKLGKVDIENGQAVEFNITDVSEILVDDNYLYVAIDKKTKKVLERYDLNGENRQEIVTNCNVSYIIQDVDTIYFTNKNDGNKIYRVGKNGTNLSKVDDIVGVADNGIMKYINGNNYMFVNNGYLYYIDIDDNNTLWSIKLDTLEKEQILSSSIEYLQNIENTVFFKQKGEMGIYLYNYDTKFISQITKRKMKEFCVDSRHVVEEIKNKNLEKS